MNSNSEPLVSVIAPVFNEEKYLAECVESVLAQTYSNWDLTIVNNQSSDGSLQIAESYARKDPRIRVVTTPEVYPQLKNWNFSMRQISPESKYCKMVCGDTWIFPECLRLMVHAAESNPTVGVVSALYLVSTGVQPNSLRYPGDLIAGREICRLQLLSDECYFMPPTTTLFTSDIVRNRVPFFREDARISSDAEACFEILQEHDFSYIHQVLSFDRSDNVSISTPARRYTRYVMHQYMQMRRYGDVFFDPAESAKILRHYRKAYYSFLAEYAMRIPEKAFWNYHRDALGTIGEKLSYSMLVKHLVLECLDLVLNPKRTFGRVVANIRQRSGANDGKSGQQMDSQQKKADQMRLSDRNTQ
jgi:glycosyltransferase involved in cell wall biosynthesis